MHDLSKQLDVPFTDARARRLAQREGYSLRKVRPGYNRAAGRYLVIDPYRNTLASSEYGLTLEEVFDFFADDAT